MKITKFALSENAIEVINAGLDLLFGKLDNDNIIWTERDIETVKTMADLIGIHTNYFWYPVEKERISNLDSSLLNIYSSDTNLDSKP